MAELDIPAPQRGRRQRRPKGLRYRRKIAVRLAPGLIQLENNEMSSIDYNEKIPNNVDLAGDRALRRALEHWQPNYLEWWQDMGPENSQDMDVYLRTAVSVDKEGWAQFSYVKMPEYRWGIF